jgi:A/G-specific adenine glycosylase
VNEGEFQDLIKQKGSELYRDMPWRSDTRPYYVLVSELMLQQTQVDRVIPKFNAFIEQFPDERTLAEASLGDVLRLWNGLGYNRRAKFLHEAAKMIMTKHKGIFPKVYEDIIALPGVGQSTAGAITAYAFNTPIVFIETNVRTVYFHHFFNDEVQISDKDLEKLVQKTFDTSHPREFYWALMDYGTWLKKNHSNLVSKSKHYKKQGTLKGSLREMRGTIIRALTDDTMTTQDTLKRFEDDVRFQPALAGLIKDGLVEITNNKFHLTK